MFGSVNFQICGANLLNVRIVSWGILHLLQRCSIRHRWLVSAHHISLKALNFIYSFIVGTGRIYCYAKQYFGIHADVVRASSVGIEERFFAGKLMNFRDPMHFHVVVDLLNLKKIGQLIELYAESCQVVRNPFEGK